MRDSKPVLNPDGGAVRWRDITYAPSGRRRGVAFVYVITRIETQQKYVGITIDAKKRWYTHRWLAKSGRSKQLLHKAMSKYGFDAFSFEVVGCSPTWASAAIAEQQIIEQVGAHVSAGGYNLTAGGEGPNGRACSEETRRRISAGNSGKAGRINTEQEKAAARDRLLRRWAENPQQFAGIASMGGKAMVGRKNSAETKAKMSAAAYMVWAGRRSAATPCDVEN